MQLVHFAPAPMALPALPYTLTPTLPFLPCVWQVVRRRKDFRLIVTSATLDAQKFADFFGRCGIWTSSHGCTIALVLLNLVAPKTQQPFVVALNCSKLFSLSCPFGRSKEPCCLERRLEALHSSS